MVKNLRTGIIQKVVDLYGNSYTEVDVDFIDLVIETKNGKQIKFNYIEV